MSDSSPSGYGPPSEKRPCPFEGAARGRVLESLRVKLELLGLPGNSVHRMLGDVQLEFELLAGLSRGKPVRAIGSEGDRENRVVAVSLLYASLWLAVADAPSRCRDLVQQWFTSRTEEGPREPALVPQQDQFGLVGSSGGIERARREILAAARGTGSVLIVGETGTGKELAARAVHSAGVAAGEFVAVNCGALPAELTESELFGAVRGAFTGAQVARLGLVRAADGGTLFLDELSEMPLQLQAKLLRVLEDKQVRPLGSTTSYAVSARFIAATNRDPERCVASGVLRADLFHRLNVHRVTLPPLRERLEDIPGLFRYFVAQHAGEGQAIEPAVFEVLLGYPWPGNVREVRNAAEVAASRAEARRITTAHLPQYLTRVSRSQVPPPTPAADAKVGALGFISERPHEVISLREGERLLIERALDAFGGNKVRAAQALGISRHRLYERLKRFNTEK